MAYTCPACLAISQNPTDEQENYCARCKEFMGANLMPDAFQEALIRALKSGSPIPALLQAITVQRLANDPPNWKAVQEAMTPLMLAARVPASRHAALSTVFTLICAQAASHPDE